ncbi:MAG: nucleotide exchange factor GrpE [Eggerthellales bacterium]|nr:nucleotide exchange factor GrpE [Eggerthellales bacterium]
MTEEPENINVEAEIISEPEGSEVAATDEEAVMAEAEAVITAAEELEAAKAEIEELKEKYLRLHAEWDTYRRRMNEQREEDKKRATEKLVDNLIPVVDDFERTIDYATNNGEAGMLDGTKAVLNKLIDALTKGGVQVLNPQGEAFNALEAQAVQMIPDESVPDETVAQVFQKGYKMGTKVLRPAMVVITTGGPKREAEE